MTLRIISFGGGVQSSAMLALAATHDPRFEEAVGGPIDAAVYANVGDDSEHPAALAWIRQVVTPWAHTHGVPVVEVERTLPDGTPETLLGRLLHGPDMKPSIPMRLGNGRPGPRICTQRFKAEVVRRWACEHGATLDDPAVVAVGISTDEVQRAHNRPTDPRERRVYPLLDLGLSRADCQRINVDTFGAEAPRSSCWFCPFHTVEAWQVMARDEPELFTRAQALEDAVNERQRRTGNSQVWLTRKAKRLTEAISPAQQDLFGAVTPDSCDEGWCHT